MHEASVVAIELARSIVRASRKPHVRIVVALLCLVLIVYRFSPKSVQADCAFRIADSAVLPVTQGDAFKVTTCVQLEIASTNSARTLGLSGRKDMARDRGMLFDF